MPYLETVQELLEAKEGKHVQFKLVLRSKNCSKFCRVSIAIRFKC